MNATAPPTEDAGSRRRSGRVVRAPKKYDPSSSKRKRGADHDDEDEENVFLYVEDESSGSDDDDDEASEDAAPRARKKRPSSSAQAGRGRKPAAKKPKINGSAPASSAKAVSLPNRAKKIARAAVERRDGDALYADVFSSGDQPDDIASRWYAKYQQQMATAMTDLVNCIILTSGCDEVVTEDDINDPDNCSNRLTELQERLEEQRITEYPLISKKDGKAVRDALVAFFKSLINILHETDVLYNDAPLMENIVRWVASMSSSGLRPFRHVATTVALAMQYALVDVAKKLDVRITKMTQQVEGEKSRQGKKRDKSSKERLAAMQRNLDEAIQNRGVCGEQMKEFFDTVYVHRYRDVAPNIRTECVESLGAWIWVLPNVYMEPEYLRYLGWMLSDTVASTRQEVLKQLARIFRRDAQKLGHFIDRFRPRLVEMATLDCDVGVRVTAVAVVEILRSTGMLEPDEIDSVGKIIFDSEHRVRKAVVPFFADCVKDLVESKLEDVGGEEAMQELFAEEPQDFESPRRDWLNIKCLAETLAAYEAQLEDDAAAALALERDAEWLSRGFPDTRISLAAQVLVDRIPQVSGWDVLAGYLLHDHSVSAKSKSRAKVRSTEAVFKAAVAPEGQEEAILLEVLAAAVKERLVQKRGAKPDPADAQEDTALQLAMAIPKLLRKYGSEPDTAAIVLRLEHPLDLDVFQQLRQDATTYARLLDEICTQFNRHVDKIVLAEAARALLHARQYDELEEVVDEKVSELWQNAINSLRNFDKTCELSARQNLDPVSATELSSVLLKISKLAPVADCLDVLEADGTSIDSSAPAIDILVRTVHRGRFEQPDEDLDTIEDELTGHAMRCCQAYFMWKKRSLERAVAKHAAVPDAAADRLVLLRRTFQTNLIHTLSSRAYNDDLRLAATGCLCDVACLFSTLRPALDQPANARRYQSLRGLLIDIPAGLVNELISIFTGAERAYAKRAKKSLNEPGIDEDPLDDDQLSDDEDDGDLGNVDRLTMELKAERTLCLLASKLVFAIAARVVDHAGPQAGKLKKRLLRNHAKLGYNYKQVTSYLDEEKRRELLAGDKKNTASAKSKGKQQQQQQAAAAAGKRPAPGAEAVVVGHDIGDPFATPEPEEGTEEDLRRRGLLDDPIEEDPPEEEEAAGGADNDVDDILGD